MLRLKHRGKPGSNPSTPQTQSLIRQANLGDTRANLGETQTGSLNHIRKLEGQKGHIGRELHEDGYQNSSNLARE